MKKMNFLVLCAGVLAMVSCCGKSGEATSCPAAGQETVVDTASIVRANMMSRRSVRKYKPTPVEREKMNIIAECGINAPNGMNRQAYEVRIVDNPEFINGISALFAKKNPKMAESPDFKNMFRNAPTVAFIACDGAYDLSEVDCGLLGENMILSAWSMGIGSCCLGGPIRFMQEDKEAASYLEKLGFSDGYRLLYAIGFGYPDESPAAKARKADKVKYVD